MAGTEANPPGTGKTKTLSNSGWPAILHHEYLMSIEATTPTNSPGIGLCEASIAVTASPLPRRCEESPA